MAEWLNLVVSSEGMYVNGVKILEADENTNFTNPVTYNDVSMMYKARLWAESEEPVPFFD